MGGLMDGWMGGKSASKQAQNRPRPAGLSDLERFQVVIGNDLARNNLTYSRLRGNKTGSFCKKPNKKRTSHHVMSGSGVESIEW